MAFECTASFRNFEIFYIFCTYLTAWCTFSRNVAQKIVLQNDVWFSVSPQLHRKTNTAYMEMFLQEKCKKDSNLFASMRLYVESDSWMCASTRIVLTFQKFIHLRYTYNNIVSIKRMIRAILSATSSSFL